MTDPRDPSFDNPPGWTDPYSELSDLSGDEPLPSLEDPSTPPAAPPRSPLLTGLIIALLLVALSVAVFQLLRSDDDETAGETTSTTQATTTTVAETTTTGATTTTNAGLPPADPYPPVGDPIPIGDLALVTGAVGDFAFGTPAGLAVGSFTSSFGEPDEDTGWQVSTGLWGVCEGDTERIVRYGPFASILTLDGDEDLFMGYRQDLSYGGLTSTAVDLATLSGLRAGDSVARLETVYGGSNFQVAYSDDASLGTIFELSSVTSGDLLLWGPVTSSDPDDGLVIGIYAPDVCDRPPPSG